MQKKGEYVAAIIFNLIAYYIFNNLLNWHVYFVTPALNQVLWIINLSIIVAILGNILLLLYNPNRLIHATKIVLNIFAFAAVYYLFVVFPFNFYNGLLNWGLAALLILGMIGIIIATIVEFFLLITNKPKLRGYKKGDN